MMGPLLTAQNVALPAKYKMAAIGLQNGRPGLERGLPLGLRVLQTTFDMSNYSKRNIDEGEKKEKIMVKIVVH